MLVLGPIGFLAPALLAALVVLPVLWILLRAVPPAPIRRRFPGVALLLGLADTETQTDRTPWWLLLLRLLAIAAVIIGFAGPVLNPEPTRGGAGPLLILADGTWADARDWPRRQDRIEGLLAEAARAGRPVAVATLTDLPQGALPFQAASSWTPRLAGIEPQPWVPDPAALAAWGNGLEGEFETYWLSDGLARDSRAGMLSALETHGTVTVFESPRPVLGLRPATYEDGAIRLTAVRADSTPAADVTVTARGLDPAGIERDLATLPMSFDAGAAETTGALSLKPELRNRITRFEIAGARSAGAVSLAGDGLKRRKVALIAGAADREGLELLSPTHYLREALAPTADIIDGTLTDVLLAGPDVIVLADVARVSEGERADLTDWVEKGGLLLRFAGPRLAASDAGRGADDTLLPVRLRIGGRNVGGAMSWGEPKGLMPFAAGSPFEGLAEPADVTVSSQVLAEPGPELAGRTIASLADGTPLVTRKPLGDGQVVLFHVTANADWSTLPLSGLFVQMLERLAVSTRPPAPTAEDLAGTVWTPEKVLDAYGILGKAGEMAGVPGEDLAGGQPAPGMAPGIYAAADERIALNVIGADTVLAPAVWPARIAVEGLAVRRETPLKGVLLSVALLALFVDILASLALSGKLAGRRAAATAAVLAALVLPQDARAQDDALALEATNNVVLAHVITGDGAVDRMADAGLRGLSEKLAERTSVEPIDPIGVDLERDDLAFFPFLYWPVSATEPTPSDAAYAKLNRYLRTGGMILFDTRDADVADYGAATPTGRRLQELALPLDIPPLQPMPDDHVLTRAFYLLKDFPGRYAGRNIWVEAAPPDAEQLEGMPFRNLNDGVTPLVIGGNDWAAAWAVDGTGNAIVPVGRGYAGERQREIAFRFGINLVMHVLTGNYKSDQVHVPALLDRLGN